jgi:ABC-type thiamine transport system ATPase subunit
MLPIRRFFILTLGFFLILWSVAGYCMSREEEIRMIDAQIEELQEKKRGYEARATRQEDLAIYLQFENQAWLETRRHLQLAETNRKKAAVIQKQIGILEDRKRQLQGQSLSKKTPSK